MVGWTIEMRKEGRWSFFKEEIKGIGLEKDLKRTKIRAQQGLKTLDKSHCTGSGWSGKGCSRPTTELAFFSLFSSLRLWVVVCPSYCRQRWPQPISSLSSLRLCFFYFFCVSYFFVIGRWLQCKEVVVRSLQRGGGVLVYKESGVVNFFSLVMGIATTKGDSG